MAELSSVRDTFPFWLWLPFQGEHRRAGQRSLPVTGAWDPRSGPAPDTCLESIPCPAGGWLLAHHVCTRRSGHRPGGGLHP